MKAVIDLGTNTFNLLIADVVGGKLVKHFETEIPVRIGKNGLENNLITEDAIRRTFDTLGEFSKVINRYDVSETRGFATSAIRNASNGKLVMDRIREEFGFRIEVIDGNQEANYIYGGVQLSVDFVTENMLVMDIGGGSVEFIIGNKKAILWKRSFDLGAVRLYEKFKISDQIIPTEIKTLTNYINQEIRELGLAIEELNPRMMVGAAGSFDTIVEVLKVDFDKKISALNENVHEVRLADFDLLKNHVLESNLGKRLAWNGMVEFRAEYFPIAVILVDLVLKKLKVDSILCSRYAMKEGVFFEI